MILTNSGYRPGGVVDLPLRKLLLSQQRADSYDDPYQNLILPLSFTTFSDSYLTYLLKHMQWFLILIKDFPPPPPPALQSHIMSLEK